MSSTYSRSDTTRIEGVVKSFEFRNPHVLLYVDVKGEDGAIINWMGEGSSATGWRRNGWTGKEFAPGDIIRISGTTTLDGSPMVWLDAMDKLDPKSRRIIGSYSPRSNPNETNLHESADSAEGSDIIIPQKLPSGIVNLSGITRSWVAPEQGGPFFRNDQKMPYSAQGQKAREAVDITNDPQVFCDPPGLARQAGFSPYGFILTQHENKIVIDYEEYSTHREIPLSDQIPPAGPKSHMGDSVARYEGEKLIIETVNLLSNWVNHTGDIMSDQGRITEVMSRADIEGTGSAIKVTTTIHDPLYLTEPRSVTRYKVFTQGYDYVENNCVPPLRDRKSDDSASLVPLAASPQVPAIKTSNEAPSKKLWIIVLLGALTIGGALLAGRKNR